MVNIPLNAPAPKPIILPVSFITQVPYKYLCWAACTAMVTSAQPQQGNLPRTVGDTAKRVQAAQLGEPCALGGETDGQAAFDQTCFPECALHNVLGLSCNKLLGWLGEADLMTEIGKNRRPVMLYITWSTGGSHVVLVIGYTRSSDGTVLFEVCDPRAEVAYPKNHAALKNFDHTGTWHWTYTRIGIAL